MADSTRTLNSNRVIDPQVGPIICGWPPPARSAVSAPWAGTAGQARLLSTGSVRNATTVAMTKAPTEASALRSPAPRVSMT